ncbi:MAG TPA: hypothetical protein VI072_12400 [Polyangiaceae bacterium]
MLPSPIDTSFRLSVTTSTLLVISCLFTLASPGCTHFERTRECHALAALINPELDAIERLGKSRSHDASALSDISVRYATLARKVGELSVEDDELGPVLTEYRGSLLRAAIHTRALAEGLRSNDTVLVSKERGELQRLSRKERVQMSQLAGHCRSG